TVGAGSFSKVKLGYLPSVSASVEDCEKVAIKMIQRRTLASSVRVKQGLDTEIDIMKSVHHKSVVRLKEVVETKDYVCLVQEFVEGGDLFDLIADRFDVLTQRSFENCFLELVEVVAYLHDLRICHRDLKIENVLMTSRATPRDPLSHTADSAAPALHIKLTDFGLAVRLSEGIDQDPSLALQEQRCGSEEYSAPEVILAQPYDPRKTDAWSLGVILFAMITGELPFSVEPGQRPKTMYHRIARVQYTFPSASLMRMRLVEAGHGGDSGAAGLGVLPLRRQMKMTVRRRRRGWG
ncbi:kinase-like domain-containing protein, partial [Chytridium lagenaria]